MQSFFASALSAQKRDPQKNFYTLLAPAKVIPLASFLQIPLQGEALLWSMEGGWSFAGRGVAARLTAKGSPRFSALRSISSELFSRVGLIAHPACQDAPSLRFFGGASFQVGGTYSSTWSDFEDADFILPRWLYAQQGERAVLLLTLSREELSQPQKALVETSLLDASLTALSQDQKTQSGTAPKIEELSPAGWSRLVEDTLSQIRAKKAQKIVLTRRSHLTAKEPFDLSQIAARMISTYRGCVHFMVSRGGSTFLGATPEQLVTIHGAELETDALAGSSPRIAGQEESISRSLLQNEKERREHQHVVAGIQEALRPLCVSVSSPEAPVVRALPNVLHLHTPIRAKIIQPAHILSFVEALHPTPSVCGSPRAFASEWISSCEPCERGWYAGPVGWFDAAGEGSFCVALRSALLQREQAWLYAGAGIVEGSEPAREYEETAAKQKAMLFALGAI